MDDLGTEWDGLESESVSALDSAVSLVNSIAERIRARIARDEPQRGIEEQALGEALVYRIRKLMEMSDEELVNIDPNQQKAFLRRIYKLRRSQIGKNAGEGPKTVPLDEDRNKEPSVVAPPARFRPSDSVVVAAWVRLLELMCRRTNRPLLAQDEATVVRFYLDCELGLPMMTPEDSDILHGFANNGRYWKRDLAKELGQRPGFVSDTITKLVLAARTAIYQFILLAPAGQAVLDRKQMGPLIDLVYGVNKHLTTPQRKLLERAPRHLVQDDDGFLIDVAGLAEDPGPRGAMTIRQTIGELHVAEERYAAQVPSQQHHPPRFRCVADCDLHRPIEEN